MQTDDYIKRIDAISLIVNGNELIGRGWLIKELATLPAADVEPKRKTGTMANGDYILRDGAINALKVSAMLRNLDSVEDGTAHRYKRAAERIIAGVPAADVEPKRQWIPVTERLPECEVGEEIGNVEWIIHDMVFAGCFGRGGKYRDAYFRTWTDTTEGIDAKDADCWRVVTLPEPPKEEKDEDTEV